MHSRRKKPDEYAASVGVSEIERVRIAGRVKISENKAKENKDVKG